MLLPSRLARTYPHHAKQRRWSETRGCGAPMASTSFPTLISPLRESSRRTESLMGLAKPSRSFARSLTSRTSRPTGISASGGASLSLSVTATPHFARVMQTSATADLSFRIPDGSRGPGGDARPLRGSACNSSALFLVSYDSLNILVYTLLRISASDPSVARTLGCWEAFETERLRDWLEVGLS